jgi:hypothetical protein
MKLTPLLAGAALCLAFVGSAQAGAYGTISFGPSKLKFSCDGTTSCDTSSNGFKLLGGYRGPENVGLEGVYWNFGKAKATVGSESATAKVDGFGMTVALHDDFAPDWTAAGRFGIARLKAKGSGPGVSASSTNTTLIGGLSLGYKLAPTLVLEGSFDYARPKFDGERVVTSMFGIGATLSF